MICQLKLNLPVHIYSYTSLKYMDYASILFFYIVPLFAFKQFIAVGALTYQNSIVKSVRLGHVGQQGLKHTERAALVEAGSLDILVFVPNPLLERSK